MDPWGELNNGRTLTLYDIARIGLFARTGLGAAIRAEGWAGTIAGGSIRYRARVRPFQRVALRARVLGWDDRFVYLDQSMWRGETCTSQALLRTAIVGDGRLVPTAEVADRLDLGESPKLPAWVRDWIDAEARRPWPPGAEGIAA